MSKILIMEDDIVDQMALMRMLKKFFPTFETKLCGNVSATISQLSTSSFCWIISDFNLPDGTVVDILPYIKSAKLICVSGELEKEEIKKLKENGLHKLLVKDQQLNYLESIRQEMQLPHGNASNNEPQDKIAFNSIEQALNKNFDQDKKIKIDILEIFLNELYPVQIPKLIAAIKNEDKNITHFLSHKIQSSFRVLGATSLIELLRNWERITSKENIQWSAIEQQLEQFNKLVDMYQLEVSKSLAKLNSN